METLVFNQYSQLSNTTSTHLQNNENNYDYHSDGSDIKPFPYPQNCHTYSSPISKIWDLLNENLNINEYFFFFNKIKYKIYPQLNIGITRQFQRPVITMDYIRAMMFIMKVRRVGQNQIRITQIKILIVNTSESNL